MPRGMTPIKGGSTRLSPRNVSSKPHFPVGARPANVYGPHINKKLPTIGPQQPSSRNYGKGAGQDFFSTLGQGDTGQTGET